MFIGRIILTARSALFILIACGMSMAKNATMSYYTPLPLAAVAFALLLRACGMKMVTDFDTSYINKIQKGVTLFRRYNKNKELTRSKNLIIRWMGERYERLAEPVFQFDEKFDAILCDEYLYSVNKSNFQHIFRFYEILKSVADESLEAINTVVPIANFSEFKVSCLNHLPKIEKLRNIARKPYLSKVTMDDIKRTITNFGLSIGTAGEGEEEKLVFEKSNPWEILNLLDDAYLGSEMTGNKYEVNSKRQVSVTSR